MFLKRKMNDSTNSYSDKILQIKEKIRQADAVIVGAGAGLSTAAGFVYTGDRFTYYFSDFEKKYGFSDMYSGGFYPYATLEEHWAYWSRYIYINRYMDAPKPVYQNLYELVKEKDYFVLTTNQTDSIGASDIASGGLQRCTEEYVIRCMTCTSQQECQRHS